MGGEKGAFVAAAPDPFHGLRKTPRAPCIHRQ